jgi:hypothetical protein
MKKVTYSVARHDQAAGSTIHDSRKVGAIPRLSKGDKLLRLIETVSEAQRGDSDDEVSLRHWSMSVHVSLLPPFEMQVRAGFFVVAQGQI